MPLFRVTAFGRAIVDLELCFALFCVAAWIALVGRPPRARATGRSPSSGRRSARCSPAAAVLIVPGRRRARGADLAARADAAVRLAAPGRRVGLVRRVWSACSCCGASAEADRRVAALSVVVPRFSNVALVVGARRSPARASARRSSTCRRSTRCGRPGYGAGDPGQDRAARSRRLHSPRATCCDRRPQLIAARERPELRRTPAARLLRGLVSGETVIVAGIVFARRSCRASRRRRRRSRLQNSALAKVGPGRVARTVSRAGYELQVLVSPNKAAAPDSFALRITKDGQPVRGANVTLAFNHLEMQMPQQEYQLTETQPGVYSRAAPALVMVGRWGLSFQITPQGRSAVHRADRRPGKRMRRPPDEPYTAISPAPPASRDAARGARSAPSPASRRAAAARAARSARPVIGAAKTFSLAGFSPPRTVVPGSRRPSRSRSSSRTASR